MGATYLESKALYLKSEKYLDIYVEAQEIKI